MAVGGGIYIDDVYYAVGVSNTWEWNISYDSISGLLVVGDDGYVYTPDGAKQLVDADYVPVLATDKPVTGSYYYTVEISASGGSSSSHKTLIDGTAYSIIGGKTLIGGTAYSIKGGRTLIGGTGYDISFAKNCEVQLTYTFPTSTSTSGTSGGVGIVAKDANDNVVDSLLIHSNSRDVTDFKYSYANVKTVTQGNSGSGVISVPLGGSVEFEVHASISGGKQATVIYVLNGTTVATENTTSQTNGTTYYTLTPITGNVTVYNEYNSIYITM